MAIVRVKPDIACVTFAADGTPTNVIADMAFDTEDPIVRAHPEWFQVDTKAVPVHRVSSVAVEDTSATPGQFRNR